MEDYRALGTQSNFLFVAAVAVGIVVIASSAAAAVVVVIDRQHIGDGVQSSLDGRVDWRCAVTYVIGIVLPCVLDFPSRQQQLHWSKVIAVVDALQDVRKMHERRNQEQLDGHQKASSGWGCYFCRGLWIGPQVVLLLVVVV